MMSSIYQQLEQYQGLIFDMDGTLLDTMPAHLAAWKMTADEFGFEFDEAWFHSLGGMPSPKITLEVNKAQGLALEPSAVSNFKMKAFVAIGRQRTANQSHVRCGKCVPRQTSDGDRYGQSTC